jgi:exonuclease SbcC
MAVAQLQSHVTAEYMRIGEVKRLSAECEQTYAKLLAHEQELKVLLQKLYEQRIKIAEHKELQERMQRELDAAVYAAEAYKNQHELTNSYKIQEFECAVLQKKAEITALNQKKEYNQKRMDELACVLHDCSQQQTILEKELIECGSVQERLTAVQRFFDKRKEVYQHIVAHGNLIHQELKRVSQQQELVGNRTHARCPLCQQDLLLDDQVRLQQQLAARASFFLSRLARVGNFVQHTKIRLQYEYQEIKQHESMLKQMGHARVRLDELHKQNEQLVREYAVVQTEVEKLALAHNHEVANLSVCEKNWRDAQHDCLAQLAHDEHYKKLLLKVHTCQEHKLLIAHDDMLDEQHIIEDMQKVDQELTLVLQNKHKLVEKRGRIAQDLAHLQELKEAGEKHAVTLGLLEQELADYQLIVQALGKDGIQAFLIESVIPEIEDEANDILSRLSDQQTRVFIESLRDLKSGGTRETLDIKISDALGIRPYELFSGGEAFRIDFALRIAISKLLARCAGASLQTLVIDEGFGSQDEDGLSLIIEMLYKIQDYFAKIIIVSHLPFLKDQAPVQFLVEKSAHGSTVRVIEQG